MKRKCAAILFSLAASVSLAVCVSGSEEKAKASEVSVVQETEASIEADEITEDKNGPSVDISVYMETNEKNQKALTEAGKKLLRQNILKDLAREYLKANGLTVSEFEFPKDGWSVDACSRWDVLVIIMESGEIPELAEYLSLEPVQRIVAESTFLTLCALGAEDSYAIMGECMDENFYLTVPDPFSEDVDLDCVPTYEEWEVEPGGVDAGREAIRRLYNGV
ncbi:MAG: hypothetical protein HUJ72_11780 [Blautia sp.]|nr:hypothetical protein [Blautia sp.]